MQKIVRMAVGFMGMAAVALGCCSISIAKTNPASSVSADSAANTQWSALVDEYFDQLYFKFKPSDATSDGFHQYDSRLEDYSREGIDKEIKEQHRYEKKITAFEAKALSQTDAADRQIILGTIHSRLLTLEVIRPWEKNPDSYSGGIANSVYVIMSRRFASSDERLRSVIARENRIPGVFEEARKNLKNPPRVYTEIALEQLPGLIGFFVNDVPTAFADATDANIKSDFAKSNAAVIDALKKYESWLKSDLLPRSNGDFRIGAEVYSQKLLYDEMVDTPLDRLLEIGMANLRKNQSEFVRIAREVDPKKTPREVLNDLGATHPAPDHLLQSFRDTFSGLIGFIQQKHILTIPSDVRPIVQETPPFERATTTASMDTPGPYEKIATEAYFNVTLPDPKESPEKINNYMGIFNRGTIVSTAIHETYPGHYVQFLWTPSAPTKVRKILGAASNAEGWAHYCEQMMLDEGFGQPGVGAKDISETRLIRLGQLQDALLRNARFIVGIQMHRGKMTFEEAVEFFEKEGYQFHENSVIETKRGTADPTYLYYTLGKIEILKLREDLRKKEGGNFSLEKFHNDFLGQGFPPIKVVRKALLGDDSPAL